MLGKGRLPNADLRARRCSYGGQKTLQSIASREFSACRKISTAARAAAVPPASVNERVRNYSRIEKIFGTDPSLHELLGLHCGFVRSR